MVVKVIFSIFVVCLRLPFCLQAQTLPSTVKPFVFPSARDNGFGGVHVGLADNFTTLWNNPAGLAGIEPQTGVAALALDVIDMDTLYDVLISGNYVRTLSELVESHFEANIDIGGPFAFGKVGNNWGWGLFNASRANFAWDPSDIFRIIPTVSEDFWITGGFGLSVVKTENHKLDIGLTGKLFFRAGYNGAPLYIIEVKHFMEKLGSWPFETQLGFGFDTGFRWTIADALTFAAVCYDAFSPAFVTEYSNSDNFLIGQKITDGWVPVTPRAGFGISWRLNYEPVHRYFSDIILSIDYRGALATLKSPVRNQLLDLSAGIEMRFHEVFSLRGGWSEMLPAGGISFNWTFMQLDLAFFGRELGREPGNNSTYCAAIDFIFRY